ncbi:crotonase/enoyl-CoA hydratase family protein [Alcanivorax sp. S6407]|uniref:crotonase/enoyl-CoA hydratase family protein n=1 Tax=Alcanivorax sp. S6407 TaxID=2926424 RepID=UPI001FF3E71E|nr:crotonase/enoyl-CoA hydratase family protein [Alcanivorax sp. S6407]MCK0153032.1 crotonase/enoyl-CoA hydratase family protein [Alcanivorax sp. S6407]
MNAPTVLTERHGSILVVTLNRADVRNAVDRPTADALRHAFEDFERDDSLCVAVLQGAGGNFCAGADLAALSDQQRRNQIDAEGVGPGPMGPTRLQLSKPVIAAVTGYAVAGGLELALWCDMRVAEQNAVFGVFCRRWGVPLIDGGTVRLPRLIGQSHAIDMILTGRPVEATEALSFGLANRVAENGKALEVAMEMAQQIAAFPQRCLRADRHSALQQWQLPEALALQQEGAGGYPVVFEEALAGAQRFSKGEGRHGQFD